jgi:hypothetical protein
MVTVSSPALLPFFALILVPPVFSVFAFITCRQSCLWSGRRCSGEIGLAFAMNHAGRGVRHCLSWIGNRLANGKEGAHKVAVNVRTGACIIHRRSSRISPSFLVKRISLFARDLREKRDGSESSSSRLAPVAHILPSRTRLTRSASGAAIAV